MHRETYSLQDLEIYQLELNNSIKNKDFESFKYLLKQIKIKEVYYNNEIFRFHLNVKVTRKNPLRFCCGKSCFKSSKVMNCNEDLIRTTCCNFHLYCKECLRSHIITSLSIKRTNKIDCEACAEYCLINEKYMEPEEFKSYITSEEYEICMKAGLDSKFIKTCQIGYENCAFRTQHMLYCDTIEFKCCGNLCKQCFGLHCEEYLRNTFLKIKHATDQLDNNILGIMCPNSHIESIKFYKIDQILSIIEYSPSTAQSKEKIKKYLIRYIHFFEDGIVRFCFLCCKLSLLKGTTKCPNCLFCVNCRILFHEGLTCEEFFDLANKEKFDITNAHFMQKIKHETHKLYPQFSKAVELLKSNNSMKNLKINTFLIPELDAFKEYTNSLLIKNYNTKYSYQFSRPFENLDSLYDNYISLEKEDGFCILPRYPQEVIGKSYFIIYKVYYEDRIIERRPRAEDLAGKPLIFGDKQWLYIPNEYSILPFIIIYVSQAIENA